MTGGIPMEPTSGTFNRLSCGQGWPSGIIPPLLQENDRGSLGTSRPDLLALRGSDLPAGER